MPKTIIEALLEINVLPAQSVLPLNSTSNFATEVWFGFVSRGYTVDGIPMGLDSTTWEAIWTTLESQRGSDVDHVCLFSHFPDEHPDDTEYLIRRILGYLGVNTFDIAHFGADPITQLQSPDFLAHAKANQLARLEFDNIQVIQLEVLEWPKALVRLKEWAEAQIYGEIPIQETNWPFVELALSQLNFDLRFDDIVVKETLARLSLSQWQLKNQLIARQATDILRLLAVQVGQSPTLSLPVSFKGLRLSKAKRRAIVAFLETLPNLQEQIAPYAALWKSVLVGLHPGTMPNAIKTRAALDALINDNLETWASKLNREQDPKTRLRLLAQRPGELLRGITREIRKGQDIGVLARAIGNIQPDDVKPSLVLSSLFGYRHPQQRLFIGKEGKPWVSETYRPEIKPDLSMLEAYWRLLLNQPNSLDTSLIGSPIWIDPQLFNLTLPLGQRKLSEGLINLGRGSRLSLGVANYIRLFVYWKESKTRVDLDLSVIAKNAKTHCYEQLSWNCYGKSEWLWHSGDIQSAPYGATEYIDIDLNSLAAKQFDYIMPQVLNYTAEHSHLALEIDTFKDLEKCHFGFMLFDEKPPENGKQYQPKAVANLVQVSSSLPNWIPFAVDINKKQIAYIDLYGKGRNVIEGNPHNQKIAQELLKWNKTRPNWGHWIHIGAQKLGLIASTRAEAAITVGLSNDCSINVLSLIGDQVWAPFEVL